MIMLPKSCIESCVFSCSSFGSINVDCCEINLMKVIEAIMNGLEETLLLDCVVISMMFVLRFGHQNSKSK